MPTCEELLTIAKQRGVANSWPYRGAVTPTEACQLAMEDPRVMLVDVRTNAERDWIGRVMIPDSKHAAVQWTLYPGAHPNTQFVEQLRNAADSNAILLFLCRSGVRSRHAAKLATESGFAHCFDILEGFEGDRDAAGHRKSIGGWCYAGLPWVGA